MRKTVFFLVLLLMPASLVFGSEYNYLEPEQFKEWIQKGKKMEIVDIQVPQEFQQHHFKGALETGAFPVKSSEEKKKLEVVVPNLKTTSKDIVIVCPRGGSGAKNSYEYLKENGIDEKRLFILKKGMQGWPYKELIVSTP